LVAAPPPIATGLDAMLASYLTGTWTAFETMCDDLWEAAVNSHPDHLANLSGSPKRFKSLDQTMRERSRQAESKTVLLDQIAANRFDLRDKMGTILRERFAFNRLSGIREAYACAFNKDFAAIDSALGDQSIDTLHYLRNSIVHDASIATDDYVKMAKVLKLPPAAKGEPLIFEGEAVIALISPVIECSKRLLLAVEKWILDRPAKPPPEGDAAAKK
jgi:hypothetical protein